MIGLQKTRCAITKILTTMFAIFFFFPKRLNRDSVVKLFHSGKNVHAFTQKALPKKTVPEIETKRDRRPRDETHEQTILQEGKRGKQWPLPRPSGLHGQWPRSATITSVGKPEKRKGESKELVLPKISIPR